MASEVQLDALPYVDQGYEEPGVKEAVSNRTFSMVLVMIGPTQLAVVSVLPFMYRQCT